MGRSPFFLYALLDGLRCSLARQLYPCRNSWQKQATPLTKNSSPPAGLPALSESCCSVLSRCLYFRHSCHTIAISDSNNLRILTFFVLVGTTNEFILTQHLSTWQLLVRRLWKPLLAR